jgi:hypothetical protein
MTPTAEPICHFDTRSGRPRGTGRTQEDVRNPGLGRNSPQEGHREEGAEQPPTPLTAYHPGPCGHASQERLAC